MTVSAGATSEAAKAQASGVVPIRSDCGGPDATRATSAERSLERYHCSYGIAPDYVETLEQAGVIFGAHDEAGAPRALELADHPFFLGTLFQPELAGDGTRAHPVIRAFAEATAVRSRASQPA